MKKAVIVSIIVAVALLICLIYNNKFDFGNFSMSSSAVKSTVEECIAGKATLYYLETCPVCKEQKQVLGGSFEKLTTINCADDSKTIFCYNAGISSVPVWVVDGKRTKGVQTLEQLKTLTGC